MRLSLKKFGLNPYKYAKRAPLVLYIGKKPAYAIIPYLTYKNISDQDTNTKTSTPVHISEAVYPFQPQTKKPHGLLYRVLFG